MRHTHFKNAGEGSFRSIFLIIGVDVSIGMFVERVVGQVHVLVVLVKFGGVRLGSEPCQAFFEYVDS